MKIKSLTIYCSSSNLLSQKYYDLAEEVANFLVKKKITIIFGGGKVGMMGKIAKSAMNSGGKVIGIIPKFLDSKEIIDRNITKTIIVKDMSQRKKKLFDFGDAFLILPGGSGTMEEAVEVISWKFLGIHKKEIIIFNYNNYWNPLIKMFEIAKKQKFGNKNLQSICKHINNFEDFTKIIH
tara:strand:- start:2649 stop:3188 length:540 start_codon:yes stop_codon:yes gene_type:complete